jgi:hypothetical protein
MAVSAGSASFEMRAVGAEQFIIRVLHLDHLRAGFGIFPIREGFFLIILGIFSIRAPLPMGRSGICHHLKIILHMAVGTHDRAHLLASEIMLSLPCAVSASSRAGLVTTKRIVSASWQLAQPMGLEM